MNQIVNTKKSKEPNTLAGILNRGKVGAEEKFNLSNDMELRFLKQEICARNGSSITLYKDQVISSQFIVQQMACNYVNLLRTTVESMSYRFTEEEMTTLLQVNCSPFWQTSFRKTPLEMVVDHYQIKSIDDLDENSNLKNLVEKLKHLNIVENYALIDICEQFWRNKRFESFKENLKQLRLNLA